MLFLFLISGAATVDGQAVGTRDSLGIWNTDRVRLAVAAGTRFLLIEAPINR